MLRLAELKQFAREAAAVIARDREVDAFEIYCSSAEHRIARLNYTSDIPCRGVEELKSLAAEGFRVRIQKQRNPREVGTASMAADFSVEAVRHALERAHRAAVVDPHFPGFPSEPRKLPAQKSEVDDLMRARDALLVQSAWAILGGAAKEFSRSEAARAPAPGLVLGGDITFTRDRIAVAASNFADIRADESAHFSSSITALVESLGAKGTASALGRSSAAVRLAGARLGREAVARALELKHGLRPAAGEYRVVLGPQPVAEILNYLVMGSLTTGAFHAANSAYLGRFGAQVMDARLSLHDEPRMRGGAITRRITCEGIPARRIELVRGGRLVGLLSNFYDTHRLETDEHRTEKLGSAAAAHNSFPPLNGYRLGNGGGRRFDQRLASNGTNVVMRAHNGVDDAELIRAVGYGLYIGRVWYTYPINGQRAGDFTCTVSGDSYLIEKGRPAAPLAPNCLRLNSNVDKILGRVIAAGKQPRPVVLWGSAEAYYVPALAIEQVTLAPVGKAS